MARLLIHVEGQTEAAFVNQGARIYTSLVTATPCVRARLMGNARQRNRRGGVKPWPTARKEIVRHLRGVTPGASPVPWWTTMGYRRAASELGPAVQRRPNSPFR